AAIRRELEDPALSEIKGKLTEYAESGRGDVSKEEMEIARIQHYFENDESVDSHINNAIQTSQDSDDGEYAYAVAELVQAMSNDPGHDKEKIKEVPEIVDNVTEHILPVDLPDEGGNTDYSDDYDDYDEDYDDSSNDSSGEPQDSSGRGTFEDSVITTVNRNMTAITIGRIDTEAFPEITANAQIASSYADDIETLKSNLELADCDCKIDEFDLEKIEYSGARIILCCDISGSMEGNIGALKDAVKKFIYDREANEKIKIVTFDDTIKGESEFETDETELYGYADGMFAQGGTNMYSAVLECMDMFPDDKDCNNIIILMSDGEDNNPAEPADIEIELGGKAEACNVSVYSIGLGESVDSNYLDAIADSGGGSFVYANDGGALDSLYELLHGQINDQYRLRYTARDTMRLTNRPMKLGFTDGTISDIKYYSIGTGGAVDGNGNKYDPNSGLQITGIIPGRVYRGKQDIEGKLLGAGFSENKKCSIKLRGRLSYSLDLEYQDENTMTFTIPHDITCDVYDAEVSIDNDMGYIPRAITVIDETKLTRTEFGPYVFTSMSKNTSRGVTTLDGAVTMNDWLQYNGKITLTGDLKNDSEILVHDGDGAQIYYDPNVCQGLAKTLAKKGLHVSIPAFNDFRLYKDTAHMNSDDYEGYMVEFVSPGPMFIADTLLISQGDAAIYPDHYMFRFSVASTIFPYQEEIVSFLSKEEKNKTKKANNEKGKFDSGSFKFEGIASRDNVGIILDINTDYSPKLNKKKDERKSRKKTSSSKRKTKKTEKTGEKKNSFFDQFEWEKNKDEAAAFDFALMLNTYDWDVDLEVSVKLSMWKAQVGGGFSIESGDLSEVFFTYDRNLLGPLGSIPKAVTYSDFNVALKGDLTQAFTKRDFSDFQLEGSFDAAIGEASSVFPKLKDFVGDMSLLEFDDTTISFGLKDGRFSAYGGTTVNFLHEIQIAKVDVNAGRFTFDNYLLQKYGRKTDGIQVKLKGGFMYQLGDTVDVEIGGTGELDLHTYFTGIDVSGGARVNFHWWWISLDHQYDGEFLIGFYKRDNGDTAFGVGLRGNNGGKTFVKHYYYDFNGESNLGNGQLT
ncbi:MAG: VWA domain-containing protein, partial [Eubacterium sp.]|nr:VWA domain-containing protein [Eubacterium sp.]